MDNFDVKNAAPRRVVVFRSLHLANLPVAYFFRALGISVYFLEPRGRLRDLAAVEQLGKHGVVWIQLSELREYDPYAEYKVTARCASKLLDDMFPSASVSAIGSHFPKMELLEAKLRILLYEALTSFIVSETPAIAVAEYFAARGSRVWLFQPTNPVSARLYGQHTAVRNLYPWALSSAIAVARRVRSRLRAALSAAVSLRQGLHLDAGEAATKPAEPPVDADVLFFPHQGPTYGDLYEKNQYYSPDPANPLHRARVCHVELWNSFAPGLQIEVANAYRRAALPFYRLVIRGPIAGLFRNIFAFLVFRRTLAGSTGIIADACAYLVLLRFRSAIAALAPFSKARLALIGYDYLCPKILCFALQSRGIKVVANQERFIFTFHDTFNVLLDRYYVIGEICKRKIEASPFCCVNEIVVTGDVRTDLIVKYSCNLLPTAASAKRHVCLVLDFHSNRDPFQNSMAVVNSWASNRLFYEHILRLAREFPAVEFVIRGKDDVWCGLPCFADILRKLDATPNVAINREYERFEESYRLAAMANSVIARHNSLGDQCLAFGLPVTFHEILVNSKNCVSWIYDYSPWPLLTHSYEALAARLQEILGNGHYLNVAERDKLVSALYGGRPDGRISDRLVRDLDSLTNPLKASA